MDPPIKPNDSDCCNSGCNPCILDVYEEQLIKYEKYLQNKDIDKKNVKNCIYPSNYSIFKLVSVEKHTRDTFFYTFDYYGSHKGSVRENDERHIQYKPGQHFLLKGCDENDFTRAYTPIPYKKNGSRTFTILVRLYKSGRMSSYLSGLKNGHETLWRGPYCDFSINYTVKNILFISQGTGIAPIYAIIKDMLSNENCDTFLHLFFCCRSIEDILLREELYECQLYWNFKHEIFLSDHSNILMKYNEVIHAKRLEKCDIQRFIENLGNNLQVLVCGSEQFETCIKKILIDCNISNESLFLF